VVYWNRGAEAVFGYASAEAIGCSLNEMIIPFDRLEEKGKSFRETLETGAATFESIRRRKDLALIYVEERFSLAKALRDVCAVIKPIAQKKGILLEVQVAPELDGVILDQQKLKQTLMAEGRKGELNADPHRG